MENDLSKCLYCGELIKEDAIVCRYCKRELPGSPGVAGKSNKIKGRSWTLALILVVGIFALLCIGSALFSAGGTTVEISGGFGEDFVDHFNEGYSSTTDLSFPSFSTIRLSGRGDGVINVSKPDGPAIVRLSTTSKDGNFAVWNVDNSGNHIDLLVNESGRYWGIRTIDFRSQEKTSHFEVNAIGTWKIDVMPVSSAKNTVVPGKIAGSGDEVILLRGELPDTAIITHSGESNFLVTAYGRLGSNVLVNEIGPYSGTVVLVDANVLEIQAIGDWSVDIK